MNDTPSPAPATAKTVMWEHWCEHPGCKKWGSFGTTTGTQTRWLCYDHDPATQAAKAAS